MLNHTNMASENPREFLAHYIQQLKQHGTAADYPPFALVQVGDACI